MNIIFNFIVISFFIVGTNIFAQSGMKNIIPTSRVVTYEVRATGLDPDGGGTYSIAADISALKSTPEWKNQDDCPPLAPRVAGDTAKKFAISTWPKARWDLVGISLKPTSISSQCWYYVVTLQDLQYTELEGRRTTVDLLVLMDGTIPPMHRIFYR